MKIIDTHTTVKELITAGFPEKQAEILVDTFVTRGLDKGSYENLIFLAIITVIFLIVLVRSFWK
jgi:hypothetical protein